MNEFALIAEYFDKSSVLRDEVIMGIGDDAAITGVPPGMQLVTSVDTLVAGVHFPLENFTPSQIATRALSVNLSDLAAMGAEPAWFTLALTLPEASPSFLNEFSEALFKKASQFHLQLIGGDTTRGPLTISIQIMGFVPEGDAIYRKGAKEKDLIYVTGELGKAVLPSYFPDALTKQEEKILYQALAEPIPRVKQGIASRGVVNAAIDISDGLLADLGHVLSQSGVGAKIFPEKIPVAPFLKKYFSEEKARTLALTYGDDYELCFCVPAEKELLFLEKMAAGHCPVSRVGEIVKGPPEIREASSKGEVMKKMGFLHFT